MRRLVFKTHNKTMSECSESSEDNHVDMSHIWASPPASPASPSASLASPPESPPRAHIPGYIRELLHALDTKHALSKVDIDDQRDVRAFLYGLKRERVLEDLVRLQKLHDLMAPSFPVKDLGLVKDQYAQVAADLNDVDRGKVVQLTAVKQRTDALNEAVTKGLLDEHRDKTLFGSIIRSHAKSFTSTTSV
jgi:hypothetical protein